MRAAATAPAMALAVLQLVSDVSAATSPPTFAAFVELHAKSYSTEEYATRRTLYEQRVQEVKSQNADASRRWTAGINSMSDWTEDERARLRGWVRGARPMHNSNHLARARPAFLQRSDTKWEEALPEEKSWMSLNAANNVYNQGGCGSCWAIAASTVLQAHAEIHGHPRTFSVQEIVSCTPNPRECGGKGRCDGATLELAMDWVMKAGCSEEADVPYHGVDGECTKSAPGAVTMMSQLTGGETTSEFSAGGAAFGMTGWEMLTQNKQEPLMRAVVERGPVGVSVAGDNWFNYESGIFDGCDKDSVIDHAVVLMGYGQEGGQKFWQIQNSWGPDWGEHGHIRLLRHDGDDWCGMDNDPQKGTACKGENDPVPVCGMCGVLYDSVVPHFS